VVQAYRISSAWHDAVQDQQEISQVGGVSFVWSLAKIRIAALILFGASTPALVGFTLTTPFVQWVCLVWLLGVALLMHGLSPGEPVMIASFCRSTSAEFLIVA
jgi:hypothetical protein